MTRTAEQTFMQAALLQAQRAVASGEVPVGAVAVHEGQVIAQAHNLVEKHHDASQHAEMLVMQAASRALRRWRLSEVDIYVTLEPCPMCASAMVLSRIRSIYFGASDPRMGACGSLFCLASHKALPHQPKLYGGLMEAECSALLRDFFQDQRARSSPRVKS